MISPTLGKSRAPWTAAPRSSIWGRFPLLTATPTRATFGVLQAAATEVDERTAAMFHRHADLSVLAYRFHWLAAPGEAAARAAQLRADPAPSTMQLWGYVDVRDVAQACRLVVEVEGLGFEVFNIIAVDTLVDIPTAELLRQYLPDLEVRKALQGTETAWSIDKARRLLGYKPRYSWRES